VPACTIGEVKGKSDSTYWSLVAFMVTGLAVWQIGPDLTMDALLSAAGGAAILACWRGTRHVAQWLAGGVAAVSGALLTLVLDRAMSGAPEDPSTGPLIVSFVGAAAVSAVLHVRIATGHDARERELDQLLLSLPTAASLCEMERRLNAAVEEAQQQRPDTWREWWKLRPSKL
jgi:hypothetical protein